MCFFLERKDIMNKELQLILSKAEHVYSDETLMKKINSGRKLKIKLGADPSRPDLHLGHTVVLRALKHFQHMGHEVIFVIGDFTAMIGDPSGKSKTRPALTFEETRRSGASYFSQVTKILDPHKTKVVYNSEWLSKMNFNDVLKLASKYTVARILERDDFNKRFKSNTPIGIHEFLYPLMQGYDSVALQADIEIGGTDQVFNLLVGRELQKDYGQEPQDVLTFPLLVGLDGKNKMSKSLDNYIGLTDSPEVMYEKAMQIPDNVLIDYFILTTDFPKNKIEEIMKGDIVEAHKTYAKEIIRMYHGEEFIEAAERRYRTIANGGIPKNISIFELTKKDLASGILVTDLLVKSELVSSKSEGRRLIEQRGISLNGQKLEDVNKILLSEDFVDGELIVQKGKNKFKKIIIK